MIGIATDAGLDLIAGVLAGLFVVAGHDAGQVVKVVDDRRTSVAVVRARALAAQRGRSEVEAA